jgi:hypothetical protein
MGRVGESAGRRDIAHSPSSMKYVIKSRVVRHVCQLAQNCSYKLSNDCVDATARP